ncbi:MAG: methyltransferase domain-containing protein [Actinomycetota bacterium]|nr:methyltransferase domain-containing protein [Actinomycetota bacterium]
MPADRYTHGHHESVLRSHRWRTAENSAGYLLAHLQAGQRLLDVGCGPGTLTADLAARVAPGEVVAVDRAEEVLAEATREFARRGLTNVRAEAGDVYALAFADGSFDVVHAHQVLQHLSDPVAALGEMARVTASGGWLAVRESDYPGMHWYPHDPLLERWLELYLALARANHAEPAAGRHLLAWAHAAGLAEVEVTATAWCFADPDQRAWWGGLWAERVEHSAFAEQAIAGGHATIGELAEIAAAWREWAASADGYFVVPHGELLARWSHPVRR